MSMSFGEAFHFYFSNVFDLSTLITYLVVAFGLSLLIKKQKMNVRGLLRLLLTFLISFVFLVLESSLLFALSSISFRYLFNYGVAFAILLFCLVMMRERVLTKSLKIFVLIASICVSEVLSKYFGIFVALFTNVRFLIQLGRSVPYLLFVLTCFLVNRFDISRYRTFSKEVLITCFSLSALLIGVSVFEHAYESHETVICLLMSVLDIVLALILDVTYVAIYSIVENRHKLISLEVQNTLVEAEKVSISIDKKNREELEKVRHDIKNQFSYVNLLLEQGKDKEAMTYINNYVKNQPVLFSFSCSNNVINSIINLELSKAQVYGLQMDIKVVVPPVLPFEDNDVVSLLTNMIDNALENYARVDGEEKIIIRILKQNDYIRFLVRNPVDGEKYDSNNLTKSKKIGKNHGYGTKIIRNIATKYNGYADFSLEKNHFICDVLLYLNVKG